MTREEQIRKKAKELGQQYFPDSANIWARSNVEACYVENACVEMAEWLDQHPQWIPVEKELPKYDVEENGLITYPYEEVLVSLYDGYVDTDTYDTQLKAWWKYEGEVEYWMPKPQPPRKE